MDVTELVTGIEASWFHRKEEFEAKDPKEEVVFRMDLIFKDAHTMGEFLSRASLQILSNDELHFLNKEYHEPRDVPESTDVQ